jgi:hypothetical protein
MLGNGIPSFVPARQEQMAQLSLQHCILLALELGLGSGE